MFKRRTLLLGGKGGSGGSKGGGKGGKGPCPDPCGKTGAGGAGPTDPYCNRCKSWAGSGFGTGTPGGPPAVPGCGSCMAANIANAVAQAKGGSGSNFCTNHQKGSQGQGPAGPNMNYWINN